MLIIRKQIQSVIRAFSRDAKVVSPINPPGIEFCSCTNVFMCFGWKICSLVTRVKALYRAGFERINFLFATSVPRQLIHTLLVPPPIYCIENKPKQTWDLGHKRQLFQLSLWKLSGWFLKIIIVMQCRLGSSEGWWVKYEAWVFIKWNYW